MKITLEDGKYEVEFDEKTGGLSATRYGQPWQDLTGNKLILALMHRIEKLESVENKVFLRHLVDVVWQEAHEDTSVPATDWADRMIQKAKSTL